MNKAQSLLEVFEDLTWENYIEVADAATKFDKHEIDMELSRQASVYSYYQGLLSISKKNLDEANLTLTTYMAQTRKDKKTRSYPKKLTAKDLDDYVFSNSTYLELSIVLNETTHKLNLLKSLVYAFIHKKDMLIQLSANGRAEKNIYS